MPDSSWKNVWDAYPHLFEGEATTTANVGVYERPLGPPIRRSEAPQLQIPDEYLEFLGLKPRK